jgi:hypothetical protein
VAPRRLGLDEIDNGVGAVADAMVSAWPGFGQSSGAGGDEPMRAAVAN